MKKNLLLILFFCSALNSFAQDSTRYQLRISVPLIDFPQNKDFPYRYPSMNQALEYSASMYDLTYFGIDKLGDAIFKTNRQGSGKGTKFLNGAFKYLAGTAFSKFGSELPIPYGVWAHEEYHRAALAAGGIGSKNGNWILSRWDGTVYGVDDQQLGKLKESNPNQLLYSYVAGVQYQVHLNQKISTEDYFKKRKLAKNGLLLYNAWYVFDYFRFSTGPVSDSVKVIGPRHENSNPMERDFAGADLTSWIYDMYHPDRPYAERDKFPGGEGVNRRIGFSDLDADAQQFLLKQKRLSLLNFVNPAIFFINRIHLGKQFSFNFFAQYAPTHFGNDIAFFVPFQLPGGDYLIGLHQFENNRKTGWGLHLGTFNRQLTKRLSTDFSVRIWNQPESFFGEKFQTGGAADLRSKYSLTRNLSLLVTLTGKTAGWEIGSPYLNSNFSARAGICFDLASAR